MALNNMKLVRLGLNIFYGQLLAVAVYDMIIYGIVGLQNDSKSMYYYTIGRILIGVAMIVAAVVSIIFLNIKRKYVALYGTGGLLTVIFGAFVAMYAFYFYYYNHINKQDKEYFPLLIEVVIKAAFLAVGAALTIFFAARGKYTLVSTSAK